MVFQTRKSVRNVSPELVQVAREMRANMTPAELVLYDALADRKLDGLRFRAQHAVEKFVFDFHCPARKFVIEVDGSVHDGQDAVTHDALRDEYVSAYGYRVLRVRNEEVLNDLPTVLDKIRQAVRE